MTWAYYLLQVNIYVVIFFAFYKILLDRETYFVLNRVYLLSAITLSMVIPFIQPEWLWGGTNHQISINAGQLNMLLANVSLVPDSNGPFNWGGFVAVIYLAGVLFFTIRLVAGLFHVKQLISTNTEGMAFSFFGKKVIDTNLPGQEIIHHHEETHIRQHHTLDVLYLELISILLWCNPVIYLYKKAIKNIHEYLADEAAAGLQGDKESYAMLLLSQAFGIDQNTLTNSFFNQSLLKKRILMLHKPRSKKVAILKYGLFLPLFAVTLLFSSATISKNEELKAMAKEIVSPVSIDMDSFQQDKDHHQTVINNAMPIDTPKKQVARKALKNGNAGTQEQGEVKPPAFQGGMEKFYKYLAANCKYPAEAVKNNIQGKVLLSFIVEKDGTISEVKVVKSLGSGTDEEAVRLLENSPKWKPATRGNKPVRVKYDVPINFALSDDQVKHMSTSQAGSPNIVKVVDQKVVNVGKSDPKNQPAYYIDGTKANPEDLNQLKSDEIESINVIKDKTAIETYGEEAKNGVVLINTKKGKQKAATSKVFEGTPQYRTFSQP